MSQKATKLRLHLAFLSIAVGATSFHDVHAQDINSRARKHVIETRAGLNLSDDTTLIEVEVIETGLVRIHYRPEQRHVVTPARPPLAICSDSHDTTLTRGPHAQTKTVSAAAFTFTSSSECKSCSPATQP